MTSSQFKYIPSPWTAGVFLVLAGVAGYFVTGIEVDNRFDRLFEQRSEHAQRYARLKEDFGSDEFVLVAVTGKPFFEFPALAAMLEAQDRLEQVPHVSHVAGMPAIFRDRFGAEDVEALEEEMTSTPFYDGLFLSEDGEVTGILVQTQPLEQAHVRDVMVEGIREAIEPLRAYGFTVHLVGVPFFNVSMNELSMGESLRLFPMAAVAALLILLTLLRSVRAAIVILLSGSLALLITLGVLVAVGKTLNVVTSIIPIILWVLSLANCIHVVVRYQHFRRLEKQPREAMNEALRDVRFPCALSAITTAFGFLSLVVADIGPVRDLGLLMAMGMLWALLVNLFLAPHLLVWLKAPAPRWTIRPSSHIYASLGRAVIAQPYPYLFIFGFLVVGGLVSIPFIQSDPNSLKFLPEDHEVVQAYNFVGDELSGMYALEVLVDTPGGWLNPEYWGPLEAMVDRISEEEHAAKVVSPLSFLKKMNQWDHDLSAEYYRLPDSREAAEDLLALVEDSEAQELARLINEEKERIRFSVLVNTLRVKDFAHLSDVAEAELAKLPDPLTGEITGITTRTERMRQNLVDTQIRSFGLAFILVFATIFVGLRSAKITAVSVLPNLMPILSVFGTMVLFGIELNAATVMVASIALGIAVDDTVHMLAAYRRELAADVGSGREAIIRAVSAVGPAITVTTATAVIGFGCLTISAFAPLAYFGLLGSVAMVVALLADLLFVPAMLSMRPSQN